MALFQARQATDYVGGAAAAAKDLGSMGSPTMTWALAKRARDEKRSDIKLQREEDDRKFIMSSMQSAIGAMGRKRERSEDKAERDKAFDFKKSQWAEGESGRISDLKNSLNEDYDDEMRQKFKSLALHNKNRRSTFERANSYLTGQIDPGGLTQQTFEETSMADWLKKPGNEMQNQKTSWKMAENRYKGLSSGLSKDTNAESAASETDLAQIIEQEKDFKAKAREAALKEKAREAAIKEGESARRTIEELQTTESDLEEAGGVVTDEDTTASDMAEVKDRLMRGRGRKAATLSQGDVRTANARLDSLAKESERAEQIDADDTSGEEAAEQAGEKFLSKLKSDETWGKDVTRQLKEGGSYEGAKASGYVGSESNWDKMREALRDTKEEASTKATKKSGEALTATLNKNKKEETELRELIAESNVAFMKEQGSQDQIPPNIGEIKDWEANTRQTPRRIVDERNETGMTPSDYQQASAQGGPPQATAEEMVAKNVTMGTPMSSSDPIPAGAGFQQRTQEERTPQRYLGALPDEGEVSVSRVALPSKPKTQKSARKLSRLQKDLEELIASDGSVDDEVALRSKIKIEKTKLRKLSYEEGVAEPTTSPRNLPPEAQAIKDAKAEAPSPGYIGNLSLLEGQEKLEEGFGTGGEMEEYKGQRGGRGAVLPTPAQIEETGRVREGEEGVPAAEREAQVASDKAKIEKLKQTPGGQKWMGLVDKAGDALMELAGMDQTREGASQEDVKKTGESLEVLLKPEEARALERERNLAQMNQRVASNEEVWDKGTVDKFYTTDEAGNVTINPQIDEDSFFNTTTQKPLSKWAEVANQEQADNDKVRSKLRSEIKKIMGSDDKDAAKKMIGIQKKMAAIPPSQWAGVKKNPTKFFLNNPDMLKHLKPKERQAQQEKMLPYIKEAHNKRLKARRQEQRQKPQPSRARPVTTPPYDQGVARNFNGIQNQMVA